MRARAQTVGAVLVSPSMTTGYDVPYDDREFQIDHWDSSPGLLVHTASRKVDAGAPVDHTTTDAATR